MYLYEYTEDSDVAEGPGQILPYAVVDYCYKPSGDDGRIRSSIRFMTIVYKIH